MREGDHVSQRERNLVEQVDLELAFPPHSDAASGEGQSSFDTNLDEPVLSSAHLSLDGEGGPDDGPFLVSPLRCFRAIPGTLGSRGVIGDFGESFSHGFCSVRRRTAPS